MDYVALGKSNLLVSRTAFGAMSLDCREIEDFGSEADEKVCALVHQAYDGGINFFDTSVSKAVCERRLGAALHGIRQNVILASKSAGVTGSQIASDLQESLSALESDYIDLFQLENPCYMPAPGGEDGVYDKLDELKKRGIIRHIGIVTENLEIAESAVKSGLYEVIQFPFNILTSDDSLKIVELCRKKDVGCIAMQPLNGGVVNNIPLALGFLHQYENVVPVWGVHTQEELQQILYFNDHPPVVDEQFLKEVEKTRNFFN